MSVRQRGELIKNTALRDTGRQGLSESSTRTSKWPRLVSGCGTGRKCINSVPEFWLTEGE